MPPTPTDRRPPPPPRECGECGAWVTTTGQTGGLFCGNGECPFPRLTWGGVSDIVPGEQRLTMVPHSSDDNQLTPTTPEGSACESR